MENFLTEILGTNINPYIWLVLLIGLILMSRIEINRENIKIKTFLIFILIVTLGAFNILDIKFSLVIALFIIFIFIEFIYVDSFQKEIINKLLYSIFDFCYKMIFEYKAGYYIIALILVSDCFEKVMGIFSPVIPEINVINVIVGYLLSCYAGIKCLKNEFATKEFSEIKKSIDDILPYYNFIKTDKLEKFSEILIQKEDKSFFERKKTYNWMSIEFFKYRIKRLRSHYEQERGQNKSKYKIVFDIIKRVKNFIFTSIKKIISILYNVIIRRKNIKLYLRGYSTIEMQLVRTLAVKNGYSSHVIQRKIYELIYSKVFFSSLKSYFEYYHYRNLNDYKYYLIYLYINIAPVKINQKYYSTILKMYNKKELDKIKIEEFYIWTLGLSHSSIEKGIEESKIANDFNMDKSELTKLIKRFSNITKRDNK